MRFFIILLLFSHILISCNGNEKSKRPKQVLTDSITKAKFAVLEFMADDKPCIALVDRRYKDFKYKEDFPVSVFITVNTIDKNDKGHPTETESKAFNTIEDSILVGLNKFTTCYIAKTTMNGYRDVIFYIAEKDQKEVSKLLAGIRKKFPRIKSYVFEKDPGWEAVSEFYTALDKVNPD